MAPGPGSTSAIESVTIQWPIPGSAPQVLPNRMPGSRYFPSLESDLQMTGAATADAVTMNGMMSEKTNARTMRNLRYTRDALRAVCKQLREVPLRPAATLAKPSWDERHSPPGMEDIDATRIALDQP